MRIPTSLPTPDLRGWRVLLESIIRVLFAGFARMRSRRRPTSGSIAGRRRCGFRDWRERVVRRINWVDQSPGMRPHWGRSGVRMSEWQKTLKDESIATLEKLADKFGHDVID